MKWLWFRLTGASGIMLLAGIGGMIWWYASQPGVKASSITRFMTTLTMQSLRWMRVPGDTTFAVGELVMVLFIFGLSTGRSYRANPSPGPISSLRGKQAPREPEPVASR